MTTRVFQQNKLLNLLITATFSLCFIVTAAAISVRTYIWSRVLKSNYQLDLRQVW